MQKHTQHKKCQCGTGSFCWELPASPLGNVDKTSQPDWIPDLDTFIINSSNQNSFLYAFFSPDPCRPPSPTSHTHAWAICVQTETLRHSDTDTDTQPTSQPAPHSSFHLSPLSPPYFPSSPAAGGRCSTASFALSSNTSATSPFPTTLATTPPTSTPAINIALTPSSAATKIHNKLAIIK